MKLPITTHDGYGDPISVDEAYGDVLIEATDGSNGLGTAYFTLTPRDARRLAKAIKKAAKRAEATL